MCFHLSVAPALSQFSLFVFNIPRRLIDLQIFSAAMVLVNVDALAKVSAELCLVVGCGG